MLQINKTHPPSLVIDNPSAPLSIRQHMINEFLRVVFIWQLESKKVNEALLDITW